LPALRLVMLDRRSGSGEEHAFVAIPPPDKIRWRAFLATDLDDHALPIPVTDVQPLDD